MRTWTLEAWLGRLRGTGPSVTGTVKVIEANPVRELLIRVEKEVDPRSMLNVEVETLIEVLGGRDV